MALIGSTIDPRMFVQDYSGFANAGAIQAAGMMNFGNQVGGAIKDYAKESKALKAEIAKGKSALQFAKTYHPELADQIDQLGQIFNDPTKSVVEQAAAGSQMGDFVAAILGGEQFKKEVGLRERELGIREAAAAQDARYGDLQYDTAALGLEQTRAQIDADATVAPVKLAAAIQALQSTPELANTFTPAFLEGARNKSPEAQSALADTIVSLLPKPAQRKFVNDFPVTINGQSYELPAMVDETTGVGTPVQLDGMVLPPKQGGDMAPPPSDIETNEGAVLPADESELVGEGVDKAGNPIEIWKFNGVNYTAPKQVGPAGTGVSVGNKVSPAGALSEKDKLDIAQKQKDAAQKQAAAVSSSEEFLLGLEKLEKHPGFNNLFGSNIGVPTWVDGSDAASAKVIFDQLEGKGFLEAVQSMKGMGALSDKEGARLSAAFLGLSPSMSEKDAKARIQEIKTLIKKGMANAKTMQPNVPQEDPYRAAASRLGSMIPPMRVD